jgi:nucleoside-diphosphate-sugar epimerase
MFMADDIFVIGATGRTGALLCRRLAALGRRYVPVVRDAAKWRALGLPGERRVVDLADNRTLADSLADATCLVSFAHARHVPALLAATEPEVRFVLLGGIARYERHPEGDGVGIRAGEGAFMSSGRSGVMLHPTMTYGRDSVHAVLARLRAGALLALPAGGRTRVQPVFEGDLVDAIVLAIDHAWPGPRTIVAAGPEGMPLAAFLRTIAERAGVAAPHIVGMPGLLMGRFGLREALAELHLPSEDQDFPTEPFQALLGRPPLRLAEGLARALS